MPSGKISDTKTRVLITVSKEVKEQLTEIAKEENRSVNNLMVTIILDYLKNRDQQ